MEFVVTYPQEREALNQLYYYLTEQQPDVQELPSGVVFTSVPFEMTEFLSITNVESGWAPIELFGLARGLVSDEGKMIAEYLGLDVFTDFQIHNQFHGIYLVKASQYEKLVNVLRMPENNNYIYYPGLDQQRMVVAGLKPLKHGLFSTRSAYLTESSLYNGHYYRFPSDFFDTLDDFKNAVQRNYSRTKRSRVIGKRKSDLSPDNSYFAKLDSFAEAWEVATGEQLKENTASFGNLNNVSNLDAFVMAAPIALGFEDIFLQASYTRITKRIDQQYKKYRFYRLNSLTKDEKEKLKQKVLI